MIQQPPYVKSLARQRYYDELNDFMSDYYKFIQDRQPEDYEEALIHHALAELARNYLLRSGVVVQQVSFEEKPQ